MDATFREGGLPSHQDTGWDRGIRSVASSRHGSSGNRNASFSNSGPSLRQTARDYARGELHIENVQATDDTSPIPFQTRPDYSSIDIDGASMAFSSFGHGPEMPYSSRIVTDADSSRSNSPTEETSPLGSPNSKFQECVPTGVGVDPFMPRFQDRRYTSADINPDTFHGRLASFVVYKWNVPFMDKRLLSRVGFYYEGVEDEVICSGCGGTLRGWQSGNDPLAEHLQNFENDCPITKQ